MKLDAQAVEAAAKTMDRHEAAQMGLPDPWSLDQDTRPEWADESIKKAKACVSAYLSALSRVPAPEPVVCDVCRDDPVLITQVEKYSAKKEEADSLKRELETVKADSVSLADYEAALELHNSIHDQLRSELSATKAKLEEAVRLLEPFAKVAEHDIGESETDQDLFCPMEGRYARAPRLTVGDLRSALAFLSSLNTDKAND